MIEATFRDATVLRRFFEAIGALCPEVNVDCNQEGLHIQTMDPTHVSLLSASFTARAMEHYRCDVDGEFGIRVEALIDSLKGLSNGTTVTLRKADGDDCLTLVTSSMQHESGLGRTATVKLTNREETKLHLPEQEYAVVSSFPSKALHSLFKDFGGVAEHVLMTVSDRTFSFEADGDTGKLDTVYRQQGGVGWSFDSSAAEMQLEYGLRYLAIFTKATALSDRAQLSVSEGVPLQLRYPMAEGSHVSYYLAPKIG